MVSFMVPLNHLPNILMYRLSNPIFSNWNQLYSHIKGWIYNFVTQNMNYLLVTKQISVDFSEGKLYFYKTISSHGSLISTSNLNERQYAYYKIFTSC